MKKLAKFDFSLTNKQLLWFGLVVILLAGFLRFYQLGQVPHGMTWDEAAIGYNGYAIFTTRRDEWLKRLPISFWSFGDYKAPLAIYLNGLFTFLFGLTLFGVRVPFALAGVMTVIGFSLWLRLLFSEFNYSVKQANFWSLIAGLLMTLSPWHLHYSRAGFESGMALGFFIWGLFFWQKFWQKTTTKKNYWLILFVLSWVAAIYTYHSSKIVIPVVGLLLVWQKRADFKQHWFKFLPAGLLGGVGLLPFTYDAFFGKGLERAGTLIFSQGLGLVQLVKTIFYQLIAHLNPQFLFFGQTTTLRHGDGMWGVLLLTTGLVGLLALYDWLKTRNKLTGLALSLIMAGLLPAVLATEVPHSNRALLALPGFLLLAIVGLQQLIELSSTAKVRTLVLFTVAHLILVGGYLTNYYQNFAKDSASAFQDGYLEAFNYVIPYEKGWDSQPPIDKIIFSSDYGQPYIYALFARKTNPIWYQGGSLIKYEFKDEVTIGDLERANTIVVASETDDLLSKNDQADKIIYGSDGRARFRIYLNLK
ncbi:MAG: ArnT family glycosyltransferase [Patescibacteria group bacterium]